MKTVILSTLVGVALTFGSLSLLHAEDGVPASATRWEYRHLLIPMDRHLESYVKTDERLLKPLQDAGAEGWELVSANEPANGLLVNGRACVEYFLKRPLP